MKTQIRNLLTAFFFVLIVGSAQGAPKPNSLDSQWVIKGPAGKLKYKTTSRGDRIMDYSHAGYMGGGVAIPKVPVKITLSPKPSGDDTARIQEAIDKVSQMRLVSNFRGAVLLRPGTYRCAKPLTIAASGVVLRGSGKGKDGSIIQMIGKPHTCIYMGGNKRDLKLGAATRIANDYVPSGTNLITVQSASGLSVGDQVIIRRTLTKEWISSLGMDKLVRGGKKQVWIKPGTKLSFERTIIGIKGNLLGLNVGLSDSIDSKFTKSAPTTVHKIVHSERTSHVGVEDLSIVSVPHKGTLAVAANNAIKIRALEDGWIRNLSSHDPLGVISFEWSANQSTRITIQAIDTHHTSKVARGAGHPADINILGSFYLIDRCKLGAKGFCYSSLGTGETAAVVLNTTCIGKGSIMPHMRWNTGLLVDSCKAPDGGIQFINRGTAGSGHGWTIGWPVAWNCTAAHFDNHAAPGTVSWMIGCKGKISDKEAKRAKVHKSNYGIYASHGTQVDPNSLYLAQLRERLGDSAVKNMGY